MASLHVFIASVALWMPSLAGAGEAPTADCKVTAEHGGIRFPVDRLDESSRCMIAPIIDRRTTVGMHGPATVPASRPLVESLLDFPWISAALARELGLAPYQASRRAPGRFWADDGQGTQGVASLLYRDEGSRVYFLEGRHVSRFFPTIHAKAVVFVRIEPESGSGRRPSTKVSAVAYVRLNSVLLHRLTRVVRFFVRETVVGKMRKGFDVADRLAQVIREDPRRVLSRLAALAGIDPLEARSLADTLIAESRITTTPMPDH